MIPFIRSLPELIAISSSKDKINITNEKKLINSTKEGSEEENRHKNSRNKLNVVLPEVPKRKRRKWVKSKEAVSRFFDELDYNNQIQSVYDLTLLDRQRNYDEHDVA